MTKCRMVLAVSVATTLTVGCGRSTSTTNTGAAKSMSTEPTNQPELPMVSNGYRLEQYVGEQVRVVGQFHQRRGQLMANPPRSHPVVNVMDVGPKAILAYTTAPLEDRIANCEVVVIATVLERLGPVKDGGDSGRSYEPRRQFDLQIEEISDCHSGGSDR